MFNQRLEWQVENNFGNCQFLGISAGTGLAIGGGLSLLGGGLQAGASKGAANIQAQAAQQAAQLQYSMYQQTAQRLQPWVSTGQAANQQLGGLLGLTGYTASGAGGMGTGSLVTPFQPTMAQLAATPGYQFTLQQGEEATQNAATAAGQGGGVLPKGSQQPGPGGSLGVSGPEGRAMTGYAEGLASTTYQQQFSNYWSQLSNIYNMLQGASQSGASAAAGVGQAGIATGQSVSNAIQTGAAAQASGLTGATNALTNSMGNVAQLGVMANIQNQLQTIAQNQGAGPMTGW